MKKAKMSIERNEEEINGDGIVNQMNNKEFLEGETLGEAVEKNQTLLDSEMKKINEALQKELNKTPAPTLGNILKEEYGELKYHISYGDKGFGIDFVDKAPSAYLAAYTVCHEAVTNVLAHHVDHKKRFKKSPFILSDAEMERFIKVQYTLDEMRRNVAAQLIQMIQKEQEEKKDETDVPTDSN